jgi:hypothetical protein
VRPFAKFMFTCEIIVKVKIIYRKQFNISDFFSRISIMNPTGEINSSDFRDLILEA